MKNDLEAAHKKWIEEVKPKKEQAERTKIDFLTYKNSEDCMPIFIRTAIPLSLTLNDPAFHLAVPNRLPGIRTFD